LTLSVATVVRLASAAVLALAAGAKLRDPRAARAGLSELGVPPRLAGPALLGTVALEGVLAASLAAGARAASYAAAAFFALGALTLARALARGGAGRPCGCFGPRSRIGRPAVLRALVLAALVGVGPWLPTVHAGTQALLAAGLVVVLVAVGALGVAVLALAREVGELRLRVAPQPALELLDEGPELGRRSSLVERFQDFGGAHFAVAVFTSDGCPMCSAVHPALDLMARDPALSLRVFDEAGESEAWRELGIPGSPYAVVLDPGGTVLSKGTFNTLGQLESLVATAQGRAAEPALA
jgi:hypothetical protein